MPINFNTVLRLKKWFSGNGRLLTKRTILRSTEDDYSEQVEYKKAVSFIF